jgi:cysteine desulfurase
MGLSHETAHGSLRLTLGKESTKEQLDYVLGVLEETVKRLREISPLYQGKINWKEDPGCIRMR